MADAGARSDRSLVGGQTMATGRPSEDNGDIHEAWRCDGGACNELTG
eukprot:COSAG03_NODE_10520_length_645_cov_1.631868_1_plen_46_part_01